MRRILMVFLLAFWAPCGMAAAQGGGKAAIHAALIRWTRALASGQGGKPVAALYAKNAILLATFAPEPLTTPATIAAYFRRLTAKPDLRATVESEKIALFDNDGAADTGLYTFSYREDGKEVRVPARFTFVWRKTGKDWLIVSHHSSVVPSAH